MTRSTTCNYARGSYQSVIWSILRFGHVGLTVYARLSVDTSGPGLLLSFLTSCWYLVIMYEYSLMVFSLNIQVIVGYV